MSVYLKGGLSWLAASLLVVSGCTAPGEGQTEKQAPTPPKTVAATASPAASALKQVQVFVDVSGGMNGFVPVNKPGDAGSEFQRTVTALLSGVEGQTGRGVRTSYYYVKEATAQSSKVLQPASYADVSQTVSSGIRNAAKGSDLTTMLREVLQRQQAQPGTVSIIVSDFIYAPANTKNVWGGKVSADVKDALSVADPSKLAVSVFANTSAFRGRFYPGRRTAPETLTGQQLPYYVWVLGPAPLVAQVNRTVLGSLAGQPQVHFNATFPTPTYGAVTGYQGQGGWFAVAGPPPGVQVTAVSAQEPVKFVVGFDLKNLPQPAQAGFQTLELDPANTDAKLLKTWAATTGPAVPAAGKSYSHFAQVQLSRLPSSQTLHLRLAPATPSWVAAYSTTDDSRIMQQGAKTFLLGSVLQGVTDFFAGQPAASAPLFDAPLLVKPD
ncbi:hypothetical protein GO988_06185 [Hymenobacter sp. HMF4947]|uniref:VWA domain-containing protein n=1 Tax=Hymenobacter ginkgonis TaxID=2682976 RepID=A0A7K1TCK6_9BACT|nr:hypothetical protein [Hymenobacter ginkgonis]MVN75911.1 hypothetical protein [Hymenobacter ginkgonis]